MMEKFEAYENAMERILGAEEGSIKIVKREFLEEYFGVEGYISGQLDQSEEKSKIKG